MQKLTMIIIAASPMQWFRVERALSRCVLTLIFFRKIAWGVLRCSIKSIFDVFHVVILWLEVMLESR